MYSASHAHPKMGNNDTNTITTSLSNTNSTSIFNIPVYVINLDRRPDRWQQVSQHLRNQGFQDITRVPAVDGTKIDSEQIRFLITEKAQKNLGKSRQTHEEFVSLGAVGCFLSHYKVWNQILRSNQPSLVIEDDALFNHKFPLAKVTKDQSMLRPYDFFLLGYIDRTGDVRSKTVDGLYPFHNWFFGTHAYYLTPAGARFFVTDALPINWQVDSYMAKKIIDNRQFSSGAHKPSLVDQDANTSDIQAYLKGLF